MDRKYDRVEMRGRERRIIGYRKCPVPKHWNGFLVLSCSSQIHLPLFYKSLCSVISLFDMSLISLLSKFLLLHRWSLTFICSIFAQYTTLIYYTETTWQMPHVDCEPHWWMSSCPQCCQPANNLVSEVQSSLSV